MPQVVPCVVLASRSELAAVSKIGAMLVPLTVSEEMGVGTATFTCADEVVFQKANS